MKGNHMAIGFNAPQPFSPALNRLVVEAAGFYMPQGWDVLDEAPDNLDAATAYWRDHGKVAVWSGASSTSIFGREDVNYAFRAWHDFHHIQGQLAFTYAGETMALALQLRDAEVLMGEAKASPHALRVAQTLLTAEVLGQRQHEDQYGHFPADQRAFTRGYLDRQGLRFNEDGEAWPLD